MKKFSFNLLLALSIIFVICCFEMADKSRVANSTGSEIFTIALPLMIVNWKLSIAEQKINYLKKKNEKLLKNSL